MSTCSSNPNLLLCRFVENGLEQPPKDGKPHRSIGDDDDAASLLWVGGR